MKRFFAVFIFLVLPPTITYAQKKKFQPIAEYIYEYLPSKYNDIDHVDTIYLRVENVTEGKVAIMQCAEYARAVRQVRKKILTWPVDTAAWNELGYQYALKSEREDIKTGNKKVLGYEGKAAISFRKSNGQRMYAEKWFYFNLELKPVSEYAFIKRITKAEKETLQVVPITELVDYPGDLLSAGYIVYAN